MSALRDVLSRLDAAKAARTRLPYRVALEEAREMLAAALKLLDSPRHIHGATTATCEPCSVVRRIREALGQ